MIDTYEEVLITLLFATVALMTTSMVFIATTLLPYVRLSRRAGIVARRIARKMNCDELIDELLIAEEIAPAAPIAQQSTAEPAAQEDPKIDRKRERLAAIVVGGQARQYIGKSLNAEQIEAMPADQVDRLYTRYEARLGATMTKTLGQAAIQLYAAAAGRVLPIPPTSQPALMAELEADPFVSHAVSALACELYHRYGMFLAPLTAALTTARHCQFEHGVARVDIDEVCQDGRGKDTEHRDAVGGANKGVCGAVPYPDTDASVSVYTD